MDKMIPVRLLTRGVNTALNGLNLHLTRRSSHDKLQQELARKATELENAMRSVAPEFPAGTWVLAPIAGGLKLWVDLGDRGVSHEAIRGNFEPGELGFILGQLKPGMRFVDVGANIGWFSIQAAARVGKQGRVIAVEPRTDLVSHVKMSAEENGFGNILTTIAAALGSAEAKSKVAWTPSGANSGGTWLMLDATVETNLRNNGAAFQDTPVTTLDAVVGQERVDLIKIDIEGAEPEAMKGALKTIEKWRPLILTEVNAMLLPLLSHVQPAEYIDSFRRFGYRAYRLVGSSMGEEILAGTAPFGEVNNIVLKPPAS
jgi:FkbM family methyltransferase